MEEEMEEVTAFAEDAAQHFRDGEDELAVGDGVADGLGDPCAGLEGAALMAGGAEVAGFAGEGEEVLVAAVRAEESRETGGKVAAAEEVPDMGDGVGAQGAHGGTVVLFVASEEIVPAVVNQLPKGRSTGAAGFWAGRIHPDFLTDKARASQDLLGWFASREIQGA